MMIRVALGAAHGNHARHELAKQRLMPGQHRNLAGSRRQDDRVDLSLGFYAIESHQFKVHRLLLT
jgi:hypothetical protein